MAGRAKGVAVSSTSVVLVGAAANRVALIFSVGDTANSSSVIVKDVVEATVTNGFPIQNGAGPLYVSGIAATARWSGIRLAAVDCVVGVIEIFSEPAGAVDPGVPLVGNT